MGELSHLDELEAEAIYIIRKKIRKKINLKKNLKRKKT